MAVSIRAHETGEDRLKREVQMKLVELQDWVRHEVMKICIVFARCRLSGTCQGSSAQSSPRCTEALARGQSGQT
jgi:hypothetical protein